MLYKPRTCLTLVLIAKYSILVGLNPKREVKEVLGTYCDMQMCRDRTSVLLFVDVFLFV